MRLSLVLLCLVALAAPRRAAAWQEPVDGVQLASAGPRFLAKDENAEKGAEPRWRDVSNANVFRRRISLELQAVPLGRALETIARKSGLRLTYSAAVLDLETPVTIAAADLTVGAALSAVLYDAGVDVLLTSAGQAALIRRVKLEAAVGSIKGRVTDKESGSPLVGATVIVQGTSRDATTGQDGQYAIADVQVGTYTVRVRYIGYAPGAVSVTVSADQETTVDFALERSAQPLDEVVTTGTIVPTEVKALPTPVTVITAEQIAQRHPFTLAAIIRQAVPSAVAFDGPNVPANTSISVRGASSLSGTGDMKIFVDGVPAAATGSTPVDPASIGRIEVIRGPQSSTIYGSDAAGGVIQIFTKRGADGNAGPQAEVDAGIGITQTPYDGYGGVLRQRYSGSVHGGDPELSFNFGGGYSHLADYAPNNGPTRQSSPSAYGGVQFSRGILKGDVFARYYVNEIPQTINPLLTQTGYVPYSRPFYYVGHFTNETYGARLTASPTSWWRNQLSVGIDRFGLRNEQERPSLTTPKDTLLRLLSFVGRKLWVGYNGTVSAALSRGVTGSVTLGVDHDVEEASQFFTTQALNTEGTILTSPPGALNQSFNRVINTGYFAQSQVDLYEAVFVTAGLRAEKNSAFGTDYGTAVLPRVGVSAVRQVGGVTIKLRGAYGKALRAPAASQASGSVTATSIRLANPELAPERQQGWDGGLDLVFGRRGSLSLTGYTQTATDLIAFLQVGSTPMPTYQFRNLGRVANKGIEVEGSVELWPWLQLQGQYGYVHSRIEVADPAGGQVQAGDEPLGVPRHTAGATLTATPRKSTTLTAGLTYVGSFRQVDVVSEIRCFATFAAPACPASFLSTFSTRAFNITYPGFAKLNATIRQRFTGQLEGYISVDNLTNNGSYEFYNGSPVAGRTTMLGLHATL
jgi:outer membrane receptor protein involved in Fe transport